MNMNLCRRIISFSLAVLVAASVYFCFTPNASAALDDRIRVGIYYGSNALPSANLQNETGYGYRFGYYDSNYRFIPLGSYSGNRITICKDSNLYLSGGVFYEAATAADYRLIGAYHVQLKGEYQSFEEAKSAAESYPYGFPAYINGKYVVRYEFYSKHAYAQADAEKYSGAKAVGGSTTCYTVVDTATGNILFEFDTGGSSCLAVQPDISGVSEPTTWFKGNRYYGNFQYNRRNGNDITVINIVDKDRYVAGVLPYEFVSSGGIESLKAGAVAVRTFACATTKHRSLGFDVCTSTDCQVYRGVYVGENSAKILEAAQATSGQCLYYDGEIIQATFYAANGGATESAANTWGSDYPYLIAQQDPHERTISFSSQDWQYMVTPDQVRKMLQKYNHNCSTIVSMEVTELTDVGNVNRVEIRDANGKTVTFTKDNVRLLNSISGVSYFSRRFRITPVYEGQTPQIPEINPPSDKPGKPVIEPDRPVIKEPEKPQVMTGPLVVDDGVTSISRDSLFVITADGVSFIEKPVSILTESGIETVFSDEAAEAEAASEAETAPDEPTTVNVGKLQGWILSGHGYGHNVGLSQWGAYAMAEEGYNYKQILEFYYPGTTLK